MNRGDRREALFEDDRDRQRSLETLGEACGKTGWQVQAYCLMDNLFHLILETPQANLVAGMKWLLSTYTSRFNRRHKEFVMMSFGRSCWNKPWFVAGAVIMGRSSTRLPKRR